MRGRKEARTVISKKGGKIEEKNEGRDADEKEKGHKAEKLE